MRFSCAVDWCKLSSIVVTARNPFDTRQPPVTRVREITKELARADAAADTKELFRELRTLTNDYAIPDDVCVTVEATYQALERADRAAHAVKA
ncbi:MAG: hypothetical protein Q4G46_07975 [Propionibacteriaceae bacterium]|nr:hypothetical protein [Propionibacteriaceae bacterium]